MIDLSRAEYYEDRGIVEVRCAECGKVVEVPCTKKQWNELNAREKCIQDIMPDISPGIREMFMTGWCDDCFPSEEEEDI